MSRAMLIRKSEAAPVATAAPPSKRGAEEFHTKAERAGRLRGELESAKSFIKGETGDESTLVRPPTGKSKADVLKTYAAVGLKNLLCDINGDQGKDLSLAELKKRLTNGIQPVHDRTPPWKGETPSAPKIVVLHHDIQAATANNVGALIEHIRAETKRISGGTDVATFSTP